MKAANKNMFLYSHKTKIDNFKKTNIMKEEKSNKKSTQTMLYVSAIMGGVLLMLLIYCLCAKNWIMSLCTGLWLISFVSWMYTFKKQSDIINERDEQLARSHFAYMTLAHFASAFDKDSVEKEDSEHECCEQCECAERAEGKHQYTSDEIQKIVEKYGKKTGKAVVFAIEGEEKNNNLICGKGKRIMYLLSTIFLEDDIREFGRMAIDAAERAKEEYNKQEKEDDKE